MNSASRGLRPTVGLRRPKSVPCVGGGRRLARGALRGRFQSAQKPSANGRPVRRMNSASRGLRPTVGLCRPKSVPCVGGGRRLARKRLEGPISIGQKPSADGRPVRRMNSASRGLRPTVGLRRPKNIICVGGGRRLARSALRGRFQSAQKPSADGRPVCRMNSASRGLRPTVGLRRPGGGSLRRRRPTPGAERLERPISIGTKAFGRQSACAPNEFGLEGPSADGRPVPTRRGFFASAEADAWRVSALRGRFQSA